ncbi:MAG TPA: tripartite tricarboxylate transporter substrate-binding protein [Afifellaceae bacterium]|nr:tripartite tricarboxylate transporter substrate-binding protein [Afifellaceae bacterium]
MRFRLFGAALAAAALVAAPAAAQSGKDFFRGKTMTYIVATAPGGGYDTYGRLIGKYLEKHLELENVLVKNMPGAGHIIGANFINASEPDGLTIGTFNTGLIYAQLVGQEGVQFDLTKMSWIGKAASESRVLVVGDHTEFETFEDVQNADRPLKLAVAGIGSASYTETRLMARAFDIQLEVLPGYSGTEDAMAIMREEVDGSFASLSSYEPFVSGGEGRFLVAVGGETEGIPQARDLVQDEVGEALVAVIESQATLARFTAGPPGIPEDRLEALREAYLAALNDPELRAETERLGIPVDPLGGEEVEQAVLAALDRPAEVRQIIADLLEVEIPTETVEASLSDVQNEGREIVFDKDGEGLTVAISGSRTAVKIDGADGKRSDLAAGMSCSVTYAPGGDNEATLVDCRR